MTRQPIGLHGPTHLPGGSDPIGPGIRLNAGYHTIHYFGPGLGGGNPAFPAGMTTDVIPNGGTAFNDFFFAAGSDANYFALCPGIYYCRMVFYFTSDPTGMLVQLVGKIPSTLTFVALNEGNILTDGELTPINPTQFFGFDTASGGYNLISSDCQFYIDPTGYDFDTRTPFQEFKVQMVNTSGGALTLLDGPKASPGLPTVHSSLTIYRMGVGVDQDLVKVGDSDFSL